LPKGFADPDSAEIRSAAAQLEKIVAGFGLSGMTKLDPRLHVELLSIVDSAVNRSKLTHAGK
jgi:hypothetical protein